MSSRLLFAFLCIASISTGCIVRDEDGCNNCNPPPAQRGDVTFLWTFSGLRCDQARDVYGVNITIPGEALANNGKYACSTAGVDGITLHDFAPGTYSYALQAVNFQNQILFEATGTFTINGNRTVTVNLAPTQPPPQPGNVSFLWTFGGRRCDQARDVYGVNITIPGEVLTNNGKYACSTAGVDGITLHDFAPGTYNYTLQAVNFQNQILFEATSTFTINGNRTVLVDLMPVGNPSSYAYLSWNFPSGQPCAQAGVASVDITLDDRAPSNFACGVGQTTPGLQTPNLAPGEHFIEFIARDTSGRPLYYFNGALVTEAYNPVSATYNLYAVGGAAISWKFTDGSVNFDCNALDTTGNLQVGINFQDTTTGQWVYGAVGDWHKCTDKPIVYSFLKPGSYKVSLYTKTASNVEYRSNSNIAPIQVQTHVFPGPGSALEVMMYRQQ